MDALPFSLLLDLGLPSQKATGAYDTLAEAKASAAEYVIKTSAVTASVVSNSTSDIVVTLKKSKDDE